MNIAFVALYDIKDIHRGSGTYYHIYQELCSQNHNVTAIGPLDIKFPFFTRLFRFITKRILLKKYFSYLDPFVGLIIGRVVQKHLKGRDFDIMLTNDYAIAGYAKIKIPVVLWTDSIFPSNYNENTHPWLLNMPWFAVFMAQIVVKKALKNISLCIVPGYWNYDEIIKYDVIEEDLLSVIPFGANIQDPGDTLEKMGTINDIKNNKLNILFVGIDFKSKKLKYAINVVEHLRRKGVDAILNVVGGEYKAYQQIIEDENLNQKQDYLNEFIKFHGKLDKKNKKDFQKLLNLYSKSDIFLLPSIAEGFGIAYVEAAAYGIPSLGYKTQGVMTSVKDGVSGVLIDLNEDITCFSEIILSWIRDSDYYRKLCHGARSHYELNGNWKVLIKRFTEHVEEKIDLYKKSLKK